MLMRRIEKVHYARFKPRAPRATNSLTVYLIIVTFTELRLLKLERYREISMAPAQGWHVRSVPYFIFGRIFLFNPGPHRRSVTQNIGIQTRYFSNLFSSCPNFLKIFSCIEYPKKVCDCTIMKLQIIPVLNKIFMGDLCPPPFWVTDRLCGPGVKKKIRPKNMER